MTSNTAPTPAQRARSQWTGEKTAWWIVFGVTTLGILMMLALWN